MRRSRISRRSADSEAAAALLTEFESLGEAVGWCADGRLDPKWSRLELLAAEMDFAGHGELVAPLLGAFDRLHGDEAPRVQAAIAHALGRIGGVEAAGPLLARLDRIEGRHPLRAQSAILWALDQLGDRTILPALRERFETLAAISEGDYPHTACLVGELARAIGRLGDRSDMDRFLRWIAVFMERACARPIPQRVPGRPWAPREESEFLGVRDALRGLLRALTLDELLGLLRTAPLWAQGAVATALASRGSLSAIEPLLGLCGAHPLIRPDIDAAVEALLPLWDTPTLLGRLEQIRGQEDHWRLRRSLVYILEDRARRDPALRRDLDALLADSR